MPLLGALACGGGEDPEVLGESEGVDDFAATPLIQDCAALGDVDGDGSITFADAQRIEAYSAGTTLRTGVRLLNSSQLFRGNVNGDGVINSVDVQLIQQYIAGIIPTFSAVCP